MVILFYVSFESLTCFQHFVLIFYKSFFDLKTKLIILMSVSWLAMSSTTTVTSFRNTSPPFSLKPENHCPSSFSLSFGTWPCGSSSIFFCVQVPISLMVSSFCLSYLLVHKPLFSHIKHVFVSPYCMHSLLIPISSCSSIPLLPYFLSVSTFFKSSSQAVYALYQNYPG